MPMQAANHSDQSSANDRVGSLSLSSAADLLKKYGLLREIVCGELWTTDVDKLSDSSRAFASLTYDSREVKHGSLLFIKGRFRGSYLGGLDERGLACYVSQREYSGLTKAPGLIVNDVHKAMSLLAAEFYGHPQNELTMIGITGTKGKTTTAFFTYAILHAYSAGRAAISSSQGICLDGKTLTTANLTTPESLDVFHMLRQAADAHMRYFVLEVSSQAYRMNRVFGLTFDVGAFLNISPDHISPVEHPTFEDYLFCKRQIIANSRAMVLGENIAYRGLLLEDVNTAKIPLCTFGVSEGKDLTLTCQTAIASQNATGRSRLVTVPDASGQVAFKAFVHGQDMGHFRLSIAGMFNIDNGAAALAIATMCGLPEADPAYQAIQRVRVPGRMEHFVSQDGIVVYIDYAHNFMSVKALIDEVYREYGHHNPYVILVTGTAGGKALDRRREIVQATSGKVDNFIFTIDDPDMEDPIAIAKEMQSYVPKGPVSGRQARTQIVVPRPRAMAVAVEHARQQPERLNVILAIGKGSDRYMEVAGKAEPYMGDRAALLHALGQSTE